MPPKGQLIVALDVDTFEKARELIGMLSPAVDIFKVGSQLFTVCGPSIVPFIINQHKKVFLDLKYHDIPNTVAQSISGAIALSANRASKDIQHLLKENPGLLMCTVHALGGKTMLQAAVQASQEAAEKHNVKRPLIIGVTVLTSEEHNNNVQDTVLKMAHLAKEAGCDGVVTSVNEARAVRQQLGEDFVIVTPGIRPEGSSPGDQKRIATPRQAIANGSNFLVVGRPIIESDNPLNAAKNILQEINS